MKPTLRTANPSDLRFVHSSWFTSHWRTHAHKRVERDVYSPEMDALIERLIGRSKVLVAYFEDVPDEVLGYSVVEYNVLHWCYVKGAYRRNGIGAGLVPEGLLYYSHATDSVGRLFATSVGLKFNPFRTQEHP